MNKENNLNALNDALFDTIRGVQSGKLDIKQAAAIKGLGDTVINGAKTLLQAHKQAGSNKTPDFFELPALEPAKQPQLPQSKTAKDITKSAGENIAARSGFESVAAYRSHVGEAVYTEELRKEKAAIKDGLNRM